VNHLLIGLSGHNRAIDRHNLISMMKTCLMSWALWMNHPDVQDRGIADPLGSDLECDADNTLMKFGIGSIPRGNLARRLIGQSRTGSKNADD